MGVTSFILGILGISISWLIPPFGLVLGLGANNLGLTTFRKPEEPHPKLAKAGWIMGAIGLIASACFWKYAISSGI